ncbi:MAG: succinylglutamate desuccinylase/aspartoacylase family protein [Alphaproteobacteria bacterium]|nr:succinylglutamate desuccinylase/aspartoacylase family protein [Alphaproteobacteria bacterium]
MPQHHAIVTVEMPSGGDVPIVRHRLRGAQPGPRVAIVAGIRGDTPEGIRVATDLLRFLVGVEADLRGTVDLYPCANPLAAHRGSRRWPFFDVDLNRLFPGRADGHPPDRVAHALVQDVIGADQVIELRGAHPAFREVPQAHVRHRDPEAAELAMHANVAVVWSRHPGPAAASTFAYQLPGTIVLEGGTGNRLTAGVSRDLTEGVINLLNTVGVLPDQHLPFHWAALTRPLRVTDDKVVRVRAGRGGLFMPEGSPWSEVQAGDLLGRVVDPVQGGEGEPIVSPVSGRLMAVREQPVVFPGSMVARVVVADSPEASEGP